MSKVKKEIVEAAILKLLTDITSTMPNATYKFLLGSATALATLNNKEQLSKLIKGIADAQGYVDVDMMKTVLHGGFAASDNKIQIELFNSKGLMSLFVKPITLTITKNDIDKLINDIEENSIKDVSLLHSTTNV